MKKLKYLDKTLLIFTIILFVVGLLMIFSASNVSAFMRSAEKSPYLYFRKQLIWLFLGSLIAVLCYFVHTKFYRKSSFWILLALILTLIATVLSKSSINDIKRSFNIGVSLQTSEFIKVIAILFIASHFYKNQDKSDKLGTVLSPLPWMIGIAFLIFLQPDLGTMLIFSMIVAFLYLILPIKFNIKFKVLAVVISFIAIILLALNAANIPIIKEYQKARNLYSDPCDLENFHDKGNQLCNGYIAINNGGLFGKGLGKSTQKYLYLPAAHTDFVFPVIIEELGAIVAILILGAMFVVIWRIIIIGKNSLNIFHALTAYGIAFYIFVHIGVNLGGVLGLTPMTGIPLPFLSYGGSYTLALTFALAIVQRINIETKLKKLRKKD